MKRDYIEFQERSVAKGYLITFRCYGTWLHGDERGSVDRRYFNRFGEPKIPANAVDQERKARQMKHDPFILDARSRAIVEAALREVCRVRGYGPFAVHVRTNHAHSVVSNADRPERIMNTFKSYATRALRAKGVVAQNRTLWSRHGSTRFLWTDDHIVAAVDYVKNGQGGELPQFD